jgi:2-enoate reductase
MPQNCNLEDVEHIKQFVDIPVVCAGRMQPAVGAEAIRDGKIDAMAVGRQFLADPHWVTKLIRGHEEDIRPCICCHTACFNLTKHNGSANDQDLSESAGMCHCAVNPISMQSKKYYIRPAKKQKTVAVIGGGIGGMEAARILTLRGHKAVIYEKSDCLGGIFIAAAAPEFKEKDKELISWFKHQIDKLGIEVHLNTEVTPEDIPEADEIIVATGAAPNRIPIPGAAEYAMDATEYLLGEKEVGDNVVIIGGGLTGCEIALDLFRKGKHPAIVEMKDDLIAVKNMCLANTSYLRDCFKTNKVPVYLNAGVKNISETEVSVQTKDEGIVTLPADNVIMSVGYHPMPLKEASEHVHLLGDCSKVGNVRSVIWGAWDIAMKI